MKVFRKIRAHMAQELRRKQLVAAIYLRYPGFHLGFNGYKMVGAVKPGEFNGNSNVPRHPGATAFGGE